jgi:ABC-type multidrug transport system fused ATPase/permease subunit
LVAAPLIGFLIILTILPVAFVQVKQNNIREAMYKKIEPYERVAYRTRWMLIDPNFMPEIRLMNGFKKMISIWRAQMKKSQDEIFENDKTIAKLDIGTETIQPLISFGSNVYLFRLLLAGTIGLDRFIFLRGMLEQANSSALSVANSVKRLHELSINLRNFGEVYETLPAIPNGSVKIKRPLTIEFNNVSFSYPGSKQVVLDDVSFLIVPGSKLALVGENGAGKTTLLKLLLRQYLPTSGTIMVNGIDIKDIEQESYYATLSNLSQEFFIVQHLTIRDNLIMGLGTEPSDEVIYKTTDLVTASEFLRKLPYKLNTRLDASFDDGTNLSGGQMQRLGVARALLKNGDVMILDEPTSAIDAKAEYAIFNNIYRAHAEKTTLIVSHRFSTVRKADKIIVMEHGKITEYGTHDELLEYNGLYREMFDTQAEGYR